MITSAQMASAQRAYDNQAEPEPLDDDGLGELIADTQKLLGWAAEALEAGDLDEAEKWATSAASDLAHLVPAPNPHVHPLFASILNPAAGVA